MSQGVLSGFPTCCLDAGLSGTESPFLLCSGGVSAWVLWLSFCASLDLLVVEGLLQDTQLLMMNPPGVTLIQAAAAMAREDHLRLLLEYG